MTLGSVVPLLVLLCALLDNIHTRTPYHWDYLPSFDVDPSIQNSSIPFASRFTPPSYLGSIRSHSAVSLGGDPGGSILVFGGTPTFLCSLWHFDVSRARNCHPGRILPPSYPGGRFAHSFLAFPGASFSSSLFGGVTPVVRLFGGIGYSTALSSISGLLQDVWDLSNFNLTAIRDGSVSTNQGVAPMWTFRSIAGGSDEWLNEPSEVSSTPFYIGGVGYASTWMIGNDPYSIGGEFTSISDVGVCKTWVFHDTTTSWSFWTHENLPGDDCALSGSYMAHWKSSDESSLWALSTEYWTRGNLYRFNVTNHSWSETMKVTVPTGRTEEPPRMGSRRTVDATPIPFPFFDGQDYVLLVGGRGYPADGSMGEVDQLAEVWRLFLRNLTWEYLPMTEDQAELTDGSGRYTGQDPYWPGREETAVVFVRNLWKVVFFGGFGGAEPGVLGDVWVMDLPKQDFECEDGIAISSESVCSGHGICNLPFGECHCNNTWGGKFCSVYRCVDGELHNDPSRVCSGRGSCGYANGSCECRGDYKGVYCEKFRWRCDDKILYDTAPCSGHGSCLMEDTSCHCDPFYGGTNCESWKCQDNILSTLSASCGGHGTCSGPGDSCECNPGYETKDHCNSLTVSSIAGIAIGTSVGIFFLVCLFVGVSACIFFLLRHRMKTTLDGEKKRLTEHYELIDLPHEWWLRNHNIDFGVVLGRGKFGVVRKGVLTLNYGVGEFLHTIVVKKIHLACQEEREVVEKEVEVMTQLRHRHVAICYGCWMELFEYPHTEVGRIGEEGADAYPQMAKLVMEFCDGGDVMTWLKNNRDSLGNMLSTKKLTLLMEIALGVEYLHSDTDSENGSKRIVVHRDLKPENILMHEDQVRITDFGLAQFGHMTEGQEEMLCGTPGYMPDPCVSHPDPRKFDSYSFGIIIWEVWMERYFYRNHSARDRLVSSGRASAFGWLEYIHAERLYPNPEMCKQMPVEVKRLMTKCISPEPSERPFFDEILKCLRKASGFVAKTPQEATEEESLRWEED